MKILKSTPPLLALMLIGLSGCNKEGDTKAAISQLQKAFPTATTTTSVTADTNNTSKEVVADIYVGQAVSLLQNNDQVGAVTLLYAVQQRPNLTPQQYIAVQETIRKVYADLVPRAANGDPKAIAAISALEKTQSQ
ncbi:MAG: hypothetical protein ABIP71_04670 [Verrucomicrobiota bacterium]